MTLNTRLEICVKKSALATLPAIRFYDATSVLVGPLIEDLWKLELTHIS